MINIYNQLTLRRLSMIMSFAWRAKLRLPRGRINSACGPQHQLLPESCQPAQPAPQISDLPSQDPTVISQFLELYLTGLFFLVGFWLTQTWKSCSRLRLVPGSHHLFSPKRTMTTTSTLGCLAGRVWWRAVIGEERAGHNQENTPLTLESSGKSLTSLSPLLHHL